MHTHRLTEEETECLRGCSSYEQYYFMRKRFEEGRCVFCELDRARNEVTYENAYWVAWENVFGNSRACATMLVIASREHWRRLTDITHDGWQSMYELCAWAESAYPMPGGMLFIRFGDMRYNTGTVPHLHWNLWVPDGTGEVVIPIAKNAEVVDAHTQRMRTFGAQYTQGEIPT